MSVNFTSDGRAVQAVDTENKVSLEFQKGQHYITVVGNGVGVQVSKELLDTFFGEAQNGGILTLPYAEELEQQGYNSGHEDGHQEGYDARDEEISEGE